MKFVEFCELYQKESVFLVLLLQNLLIKKKQFGNNIKKCNGEETLCGIKQFKKF